MLLEKKTQTLNITIRRAIPVLTNTEKCFIKQVPDFGCALKRLLYNTIIINPHFAITELVKNHLCPWTDFVNLNNTFWCRIAVHTYQVGNGSLLRALLGHQKLVLSHAGVFKFFLNNLGILKSKANQGSRYPAVV